MINASKICIGFVLDRCMNTAGIEKVGLTNIHVTKLRKSQIVKMAKD